MVDGIRRRTTFRCTAAGKHQPKHKRDIDPADFHKGKSIRKECPAHVNVVPIGSEVHISLANFTHNHAPPVPPGAPIRKRPNAEEKGIVAKLATNSNQQFRRGQIGVVLEAKTGRSLEPCQITNLMNTARAAANSEVDELGGDIPAIISSLEQKSQEEHGWKYFVKISAEGVVTGIFWQSPLQLALARQYSDVLINDNTYNRNTSGYPLNIGITIDSHGQSRNIWYAFHAIEDQEHFSWVLRNHVSTAGAPPDCLMSDRNRALIAAAAAEMPLTEHFFCIHHLDGNITTHVQCGLASANDFQAFKNAFWGVYRSVSPDVFEIKWHELTTRFPSAKNYLDSEIYPSREQWAWPWVSNKFTCGVRMNGRVEGENRVNKSIGGPTCQLKLVFDGLNKRTEGQNIQTLTRTRDVSSLLSDI